MSEGKLLMPGGHAADSEVIARMRGWGGRWQTLQYILPGGSMAFEFGASKFEHIACEFMKAQIAAGGPPQTDEELAAQAVTRAVALVNTFQRMNVQVQTVRAPGSVPESHVAPTVQS